MMRNLPSFKRFFGFTLDFLFPKENSVFDLEKKSEEEILTLLIENQASQNDDGFISLFAYSDEKVKHLIWEIKYYRNKKLSDLCGLLLANRILENFEKTGSAHEKFFLIPIPSTKRRKRERGFDHTNMIAEAILKHLPENFYLADDCLKKVRHTPKQSSIEDREERFRNIIGAFDVSSAKSVFEKNIILIDDVITTGATMNEARKTLLTAGAKNIQAFSIAH